MSMERSYEAKGSRPKQDPELNQKSSSNVNGIVFLQRMFTCSPPKRWVSGKCTHSSETMTCFMFLPFSCYSSIPTQQWLGHQRCFQTCAQGIVAATTKSKSGVSIMATKRPYKVKFIRSCKHQFVCIPLSFLRAPQRPTAEDPKPKRATNVFSRFCTSMCVETLH